MGRHIKSDHELMADFRRGDSAAFQKLVRRHHLSLYNFFFALVRCDSLAESLAKEVFLRIYVEKRDLSATASFTLGMLKIGCLCWREFLRGSPIALSPVIARDDEAAGCGASEASNGFEDDQEVLRLYNRLLPESKLVLTLSEISGLSYAEIAHVLGVPVETVKARIHDAYAALKAQMGPLRSRGSAINSGSA